MIIARCKGSISWETHKMVPNKLGYTMLYIPGYLQNGFSQSDINQHYST